MRNSTLLFLIKKSDSGITDICLAMKKKGFGMGRWNGVGGKVEGSESIEDATRRETLEEIGVEVRDLSLVARHTFLFPHKPDWNQVTHVYFCESWMNDPVESDEMSPLWHKIADIPFDKMWPDDIFWLPQVLKGDLIRSEFTFGEEGEGNSILSKKVEVVSSL